VRVTEAICESCNRKRGEKHIATTKRPSIETLEHWTFDGDVEAAERSFWG
jgi:hypothetical protein